MWREIKMKIELTKENLSRLKEWYMDLSDIYTFNEYVNKLIAQYMKEGE